MKIVAISDTHNIHDKLTIEPCDILIHCGDYSFKGRDWEVSDFYRWLNDQPAKHIISVQGNHELGVEKDFEHMKALALSLCPRVHFMDEGLVEIEGLKFWCSAITPFFHNWAWNRYGSEIVGHWDKIPEDVDVLITHGPPYGILDAVFHMDGVTIRERVGCMHLYDRIKSLTKLKYHLFGHIHGSNGEYNFGGVQFYNVSNCGETYAIDYPPRVIEL